jgi:hypothetical protein
MQVMPAAGAMREAVARDAAVGAAHGYSRAALLKAWVPAVLALLLLDATFNLWFWRIPKLTSASGDYGYEFLLTAHRLREQPKAPGEVRVLATGSSIAGSFEPSQVESLLTADAQAPPIAVDRLLLPGIKPSDLHLFFATEGADLHPDVVAVLLNPLDFLNPSFEHDLKPQVRYVLPPWETLHARGAFIPTVSGKLDLALASVSNLYRYRKLLRSAIEDHARWLLGFVRRRTPANGYGWYADGWSRQEFGVPINGAEAFEYWVDSAWLQQRGTVALEFATASGVVARRTESEPGWKTLPLPAGAGPLLHVSADSAWSPRAADGQGDTRLLGVRLRARSSLTPPEQARAPLRYPPLERAHVDALLRMNGTAGEEFARRWARLLEADTEFGRRFRAYRDSKVAVRNEPIEPTGEYAELERLVALLHGRGTTVLLINGPESSLMRDLYENGAHYRSYVAFLADLAGRYPGTQFQDLRAQLPNDDFNDWHHVTYIGAAKLGPVYAALLKPLVARQAAPAAAGS